MIKFLFKDNLKNVSFVFIFIPLFLSVIGLVFIYSTGITGARNNGQYIHQIIWILLGLIFAVIIINIDYYRLVENSHYLYFAGLFFLILTLLIGKTVNGSKSWLGFLGLGIQPSEIMKLFYILFFAKYLSNAPILERKNQVFLVSFAIFLGPAVMILLEPNIGTLLVYIIIFIFMLYMGMPEDRYVRYIVIVGVISLTILIGIAFYKYYLKGGGSNIGIIEVLISFNTLFTISVTMFLYSFITMIIDFFNPVKFIKKLLPITLIIGVSFLFSAVAIKALKNYQWNRVLVMINPEFDKSGAGYNVIQSKIAIGSGGVFGKGLFKGTQNTLRFLPEKSTDFIYSIISEELGFFGSSIVFFSFLLYFVFIIRTVQNAKDKEGMLAATGLLALFFSHFIINIGMSLGFTPAIGVPLPFISYGGSNYLTFIGSAALLSNVYSRRFVH